MTQLTSNNQNTDAPTNVVPLAGYVFAENTFRSRAPRETDARVLIGRIKNRYTLFNEKAQEE